MADTDGNGNGNGKQMNNLANNVIAVLITRGVTLLGVPAMIAGLVWLGSQLADSHDRLTRIEQLIMDKNVSVDQRLTDHEDRIRTIEAAHRNGAP